MSDVMVAIILGLFGLSALGASWLVKRSGPRDGLRLAERHMTTRQRRVVFGLGGLALVALLAPFSEGVRSGIARAVGDRALAGLLVVALGTLLGLAIGLGEGLRGPEEVPVDASAAQIRAVKERRRAAAYFGCLAGALGLLAGLSWLGAAGWGVAVFWITLFIFAHLQTGAASRRAPRA
jgi:MFS family permease